MFLFNVFVGRQLCWKDHLVFSCNAVCQYVWMDGRQISSTSKGKPSLSNENAMTDFHLTWYVGSGGTSSTHVVCHYQMRIFNTSFAYLFWLANNKKVKYPEVCMGYVDETWYVDSGGTQVLPMCFVITKCAYLIPHLHICSDWLITKKSNIQSSVWATLMKLGMWVVMGTSTTHVVYCHRMCIFNTSFLYLFWLANK